MLKIVKEVLSFIGKQSQGKGTAPADQGSDTTLTSGKFTHEGTS